MLLVAGALAQPRSRLEDPPLELFALDARVWQGPVVSGRRATVVVLLPRERREGQRFPLLIALHGLGETWRGHERGAWGWARDYALPRADRALRDAPLDAADLEGLVDPARLSELNASLRANRYEGLVVLLPFTPDVRAQLDGPEHRAYDRWLSGELVARARRELPVLTTREATGIDGVSLGGLHALWTGLAHPETFGAVGALQPAVRARHASVLARYASSSRRPSQRIRVVTSLGDSLRADVTELVSAMSRARIAHEFKILQGPHDYVFNRGPGAVEMLLFHDRALRGLAAP
jgi:enterochelin esterase-like enzyme